MVSNRKSTLIYTQYGKYHAKSITIMENPYERQQKNILSRIIVNVERLNQSVITLNQELSNVNKKNKNIEIIGQICENYHNSTQFNLDATGNRKPPF